MNYLQLCQRVKLDSGQSGAIVNAESANLTGDDANIVRWVKDAWLEIQGLQNWPFLRSRASFSTVIGQREYTLANMGISTLKTYDRAYGSLTVGTSKYPFQWMDWASFRDLLDYFPAQSGLPQFATITGGRSLKFDFIPNQVATVEFDYYTRPIELTLNTDTPAIDADDQMVIVYRALMMYAADAGGDAMIVYQNAQQNYQLALRKLRRTWAESQTVSWSALA